MPDPIVDLVTVTLECGYACSFYEPELAASYAAEVTARGVSCLTTFDYADGTRGGVFHIVDPADNLVTVVAVPEYPADQRLAA